MTERKVLNKYFPPDYDPSKIPRIRRGDRRRQFNIRTMAPFNMRCNTCNGYIYKAKKFNSRMETAENVDYLGLRHYRFYIRCPTCCAEIIWRTDLESGDYVLESGAKRNFEALKTAEELEAKRQAEEEEELANNPMKLLEKRTDQSKQEMEMVEVLEDLKQLNQRQAGMEADHVLLRKLWQEEQATKEAEKEADEALIKELLASKFKSPSSDEIVSIQPVDDKNPVVGKTHTPTRPSFPNKVGKSYLKRQLEGAVIIRHKSETSTKTPGKIVVGSSTTSSIDHGKDEPNTKVTKSDPDYSNKTNKSEQFSSCTCLPGMVYSDDSDST